METNLNDHAANFASKQALEEQGIFFDKSDFENLNNIELSELFGFFFAWTEFRQTVPEIVQDIFEDIRSEFVRRHDEQFVNEYEDQLTNKFKSIE